MSDIETNKQTIRRMFGEVINLGNVDLVDELFDPEFEGTMPGGVLDREQFKGFVHMWLAAFPGLQCEVYDLVAEGDLVAWGVIARGTHAGEFMGIPATGRSVEFDSLNIAELRDGRGYRHKVIMDIPSLIAQLGVSPEPATAAR